MKRTSKLRPVCRGTAPLTVLTLLLVFQGAQVTKIEAQNPRFEQAVDNSIDQGVEFLLGDINRSGRWTAGQKYVSGYIALQIYALLKNDVSYFHPLIQRGFRGLEQYPLEKVYAVSLAIMAYGAALDQLGQETSSESSLPFFHAPDKPPMSRARIVKSMRAALTWLINARVRKEGAWDYEALPPKVNPKTARYDHSNSQFAILALGIAEKHGLKVPRKIWEEIADHFIKYQDAAGEVIDSRPEFVEPPEDDEESSRRKITRRLRPGERLYQGSDIEVRARGWGYTVDDLGNKPTFSMTSAGQSSVLLAYRTLAPKGSWSKRTKGLEKSIRDGYGWLSRFLKEGSRLQFDPYSLYSLEKVGDLGEVEKFGICAWYEYGADFLISRQLANGCWGTPNTGSVRHDTALALLFLGRATSFENLRPMVIMTGPGARARDGFSNRYYVYLPSIDGTVPIIRFFRKLRYRPTRRLIKLSHELLEVYDQEYLDELVLFSLTLARSPSKKINKHGAELLKKLTGIVRQDAGSYIEWVQEWRRVLHVGRLRLPETVNELRRRLLESPSTSLRLKIIWALQRLDDEAAIGELLTVMSSEEAALRRAAHGAVVMLSKEKFPFHPEAPSQTRKEELERWKAWWKEKSGNERSPGDESENSDDSDEEATPAPRSRSN